jgi:hypothetical protein
LGRVEKFYDWPQTLAGTIEQERCYSLFIKHKKAISTLIAIHRTADVIFLGENMTTLRSTRYVGAICAAVGLALSASGPAQAAAIPLVNGSFETGDFTGWTVTGNTGFAGVTCPGPGPIVAQGNCSAFLGAVGSLGFLNQTFDAGSNVAVSFTFSWSGDGGTPSEFSAEIDGVPMLDLFDPPAIGMHQVTVSGMTNNVSGTHTFSFNERNDPGFMFVDAVSGSIPEPATLGLIGIALAGLGFGRRRVAR